MSVHKSWRLLPAVLGAAALTFTLPGIASADHTTINDEPADQVPSVRWDGETRYDTASKLAVEGTEAAISTPATAAILATGENFPDALAGSYLSGQVGGPILLTQKSGIPAETLDRLTSDEATGLREVTTVYLLGGPDAIDQVVVDQLEDEGFTVERIAGETRIDTAAMIATDATDATVGEVDGMATAIVARADAFPDALVTGAAARSADLPLLLTNTDELPQVTIDALEDLGIEQVLLPGGPVAISAAVETALTDLGYDVERFDGETRRDTAVQFAQYSVDSLGFTTTDLGLARGDFYTDALALAPFAGREGFPIVLSENPTSLGDETAAYLTSIADCTNDTLYIPGGPDAMSADVEALARDAFTTDADCTGIDNEAPTLLSALVEAEGEATDTAGRALPGPGDDVVRAIFDESVTGTDTVPSQFRHTSTGGDTTEATSIEFTDTDEVIVGFPGGTVTAGEGTITYLQAGDPTARVKDLAEVPNDAVNNTTVEIADAFIVNATDDAVDAEAGDGECATADGDCTLRAAVQEGNASEGADVVFVGAGTYALTIEGADEDEAATGDLDVTEELILRGSGADTTVIDAEALNDRVFDVVANASFSGVTLTNGEVTGAADRGGAIRIATPDDAETPIAVRIADSVIADSLAPQAGGGLENTGADVTITGTDFTGNAISEAANPGNGGALHAVGGTTNVTDGTVAGNTGVEGGGFWIGGGGTLAVSGTTFDQNVATGETADAGDRKGGGAIYNDGATLAVDTATFTTNTAIAGAGSGGAILSIGEGTTDVMTSTFDGNTADRAGGAIENDGSTTTVTDTVFTGNTATGDNSAGNGGAIHAIGDTTVTGGSADDNTADEGGAFWVGGGATLTVDQTTFDANTAEGDTDVANGGGALYNIGANLTVTGAEFTGNTATGNLGSGGAVLSIDNPEPAADAITSITDSTFTSNTAVRAGGAIENAGGSELTVSGGTFTTNGFSDGDAPSNGGAIHDGGSTTTISGGTYTGNTAIEGGALWVSGTMTVTGAILTDNLATSNGSALYNSDAGSLELEDVNATSSLPTPTVSVLFHELDNGATTDTTAGGNNLDDGAGELNATCAADVGDSQVGTEADGNTDDDNTCFTGPEA